MHSCDWTLKANLILSVYDLSCTHIVNLSLFEKVWYTGEWELPVICRVAEQILPIELHSLKLQIDYGAQTTEAMLGSWKCIGPNIPHIQHPVKFGYLSPRAVYLW